MKGDNFLFLRKNNWHLDFVTLFDLRRLVKKFYYVLINVYLHIVSNHKHFLPNLIINKENIKDLRLSDFIIDSKRNYIPENNVIPYIQFLSVIISSYYLKITIVLRKISHST